MSLKHRMLGAAVLIALAVIFIPMFMSSAPPQKSADTQTSNLSIPPAPEREFQDRVLPVTPAATTPTATDGDPNRITTVDTTTDTSSPAPPPADNASTTSTTPGTSAAPPAKSTATPTTTPKGDASTGATDTAKPSPGRAADGRFFVHLGVYTSKSNADDLVAALKKSGYPAFAEASTVKGKPAARVRVGPFEDRAAVEAARLKIKQLKPGVPGSVVQLAGDAKADAAALPANRAGAYAVQLGAIKSETDANKLRDKVKNAGFAAFVDKINSNGETLWRVRAGPEVDRVAADRLRAGIKEKLKIEGMIVTQQ